MIVSNVPLHEAVEIFGEDLKPVLEEKRLSLREEITGLEDQLEKILERVPDHKEAWFLRQVAGLDLATKIEGLEKELERIEKALLLSSKDTKEWVKRKEKAKSWPIEELFRGRLKEASKRLTGRCPFHDDKTPSFEIRKDKNTFRCYGCGQQGDAITFYQLQTGSDFRTAVERLS